MFLYLFVCIIIFFDSKKYNYSVYQCLEDLWWHNPPKIIGYGEDADKQIFDIYSFSHVTHGIMFYFILQSLKIEPILGLYISIIVEILWEIIENTEYIIKKYRKTYKSYEGDSIVNMVGDVICTIMGIYLPIHFLLYQ